MKSRWIVAPFLAALLAGGCADSSTTTNERRGACDVHPAKSSVPSNSSAGAAVERVTYGDQVRSAEVVVVGTVRTSTVKPMRGANDFDIPLRTTTFAVDCLLRGRKADSKSVEITEIFGEDHAQGLTKNGTYLVFAEHRTLLGKYRRLVPMGAAQGIYPVNTRGQAFNETNGRHELAKVVREVKDSPGPKNP